MKIGFRLVAFILISFASVYLFYLPYLDIKEQTIIKLNEKQMLLAKQAAFGIENFFKEQRNLLRHFATSPNFINLTDTGRASIAREVDNHHDVIKAITIYDKDGIITYSYPNPEAVVGKNISNQKHVKKILKERKTNVSDVFMALQGFQAVALSEPIFKDETFVGVIAFLIDFKHIAKTYLEGIQIGKDGYAWMISRDGTELYCPVPGHTGVNVKETSSEFPSVLSMAAEMQNGKSGTTAYTYDMVKGSRTEVITKYAVYYPISVFNNLWSITVATPDSEVYSELESFYSKMILAVLIVLSALTFFGFTLMREFNLEKVNKQLEKRVAEEMGKREQQEKLMLQQAKFYSMGETLNAIAHQWRQPLNSIGLCIQDIEDAYRVGQIDQEYLEKMVGMSMENLNKLSKTIDDFRSFFASNEIRQSINVCTLVYNAQQVVKDQFEELNIDIDFLADGNYADHEEDCQLERYKIEMFPDLMKQVIINCLQNSKEAIVHRIKAGEIERGAVHISLERPNGDIVIQITDNGGGISEELQAKIFDPYFTTKDESIGIGLGLYITKNILEEHMSGSITLENVADGTCATLKFRASDSV